MFGHKVHLLLQIVAILAVTFALEGGATKAVLAGNLPYEGSSGYTFRESNMAMENGPCI